jgi:vancomycin aglycone glucosyltransferase
MRVLLSTYDSRGGVEPLMGLAVRLRALGTEVRVCAPPDCAERLAEVGVPLTGRPTGAPAGARGDAPQVVVPQWADQPCRRRHDPMGNPPNQPR